MEQEKLQLSEYQKAELENAFRLFKPNSKGKIHVSQVTNLLEGLEIAREEQPTERVGVYRVHSLSETNSPLTQPPSPLSGRPESRFSLNSFPNGEDECDFETFLKIIEENMSSYDSLEESLRHTFKLIDVKRTGKIEAQDLKTVADLLGEPIESDAEAQRLLNLMTMMETNSASFDEFFAYFMKTLKPERSP
mmetsp:Transcript_9574/g.18665  ORF Transcript_9574/g.18665 Transcript_9574/m.18665 type:complete len:192 (+) Transcript_9574:2298-2873(+)|eukprot:CAMPEP_0204916202 /NCGR_PEP_ID=MMETSP1397-20131031/14083_1 /ASSEMBLY_ACC=CAM_ASM_000891 /TAXON_ID=49980 /ORGANISM="Climacostomum Climacostomum virens, Strain Stock W-24" /LENGTH=191 /DNA_ID=CAMNT_0052088627 /DNA_START=39 /DNA_END=614 /DNA_ORIENTATION=-